MASVSGVRQLATAEGLDESPFAVGLLMRRAHDRFAGAMADAVRELGIELRHFMVMIRLAQEGPLSQSALAQRTQHEKAAMVRIVDDLERAGLATRELVPGDRRVRLVRLTDHGRAVFERAHELADPAAQRQLADLSEAEQAQLKQLLARLV